IEYDSASLNSQHSTLNPQLSKRVMNCVDFALAGFGAWGKLHARSIAENPDARLAAVCAPTEITRAEARAAYPKTRLFSDPMEMIASGGFDVIDIVTPSHTHRDIALAAMRSGKHVLLE